jgi:hypothetical protein
VGLQGTIDTIPVGEVLRMLCGVGQHGVLEVRGDATRASLSLEAGDLVGGDIDGLVVAPVDRSALVLRLVDVLCGVLRLELGGYTFRPGRAEASPVGRVPLDEVFERSRHAAEAWGPVAATVPAFDTIPVLVESEDDEALTLNRSVLRLVAAIDGRRTVAEVGGLCDRSAAEAAVPIAGLVARGVVELRSSAAAPVAAPDVAPAPIVEEVAREQAALAARLVDAHRGPEVDAASRALADLAGLDGLTGAAEVAVAAADPIETHVSPEAEHLAALAAELGHEAPPEVADPEGEHTTITADRGALLRLFSGLRTENP